MSNPGTPTVLTALLRQHGFSRIKARVWAEFVDQVLTIYWQAADQLVDSTNWVQFRQKTGAMGKPKLGRAGTAIQYPNEDAITSEIGFRADKLFQALPAGHFLRLHSVKLTYEKLVPSKKRAGRHSKKVDFHAISQYPDAPEIAIEAKPIKSQADIKKQYLGATGIGCFLTSDSPYTKGPLAAMVAYSISSQSHLMQAHILTALQKYQPAPIHIHRVNLRCAGSVNCSNHDRGQWELKPVTILHLERVFRCD